jgi:hypothetical protein
MGADREAGVGGRDETPEERSDRNLADLLQELRVAALGVQVLFGFLLALPFSTGFTKLDAPQRHLYVATLVFAAMATALLAGPVAYHRLVFRRHRKTELVSVSNAMAIGGLVAVGLAVTSAVWLIVSFVASGWPVPVIARVVALWFVGFWLVIPLVGRLRG